MTISRVVKRKYLEQYIDNRATRSYFDPATVNNILEIITKENVELDFETNSVDSVFIRIEQIIHDKQRVMPWATSGGALTQDNPLTQIGVSFFNTLKGMPFVKDRDIRYFPNTITIDTDANYATLTINSACEL